MIEQIHYRSCDWTAIGNIVGALYGLLSDDALGNAGNPRFGRGLLGGEHRDTKLPMIKPVKTVADSRTGTCHG